MYHLKNKKRFRLVSFFSIFLLLIQCFSFIDFSKVYAQETNYQIDNYIADNNTANDFQEILNFSENSRYAGRVWTDKTVFAPDKSTLEGSVYYKNVNGTLSQEVGAGTQLNYKNGFLNTLSALGSSINVVPNSAADLSILIDTSLSMGIYILDNEQSVAPSSGLPPEQNASTRIQKTVDALNNSLGSYTNQDLKNNSSYSNRFSVSFYGKTSPTDSIINLDSYQLYNDNDTFFNVVGYAIQYKNTADKNDYFFVPNDLVTKGIEALTESSQISLEGNEFYLVKANGNVPIFTKSGDLWDISWETNAPKANNSVELSNIWNTDEGNRFCLQFVGQGTNGTVNKYIADWNNDANVYGFNQIVGSTIDISNTGTDTNIQAGLWNAFSTLWTATNLTLPNGETRTPAMIILSDGATKCLPGEMSLNNSGLNQLMWYSYSDTNVNEAQYENNYNSTFSPIYILQALLTASYGKSAVQANYFGSSKYIDNNQSESNLQNFPDDHTGKIIQGENENQFNIYSIGIDIISTASDFEDENNKNLVPRIYSILDPSNYFKPSDQLSNEILSLGNYNIYPALYPSLLHNIGEFTKAENPFYTGQGNIYSQYNDDSGLNLGSIAIPNYSNTEEDISNIINYNVVDIAYTLYSNWSLANLNRNVNTKNGSGVFKIGAWPDTKQIQISTDNYIYPINEAGSEYSNINYKNNVKIQFPQLPWPRSGVNGDTSNVLEQNLNFKDFQIGNQEQTNSYYFQNSGTDNEYLYITKENIINNINYVNEFDPIGSDNLEDFLGDLIEDIGSEGFTPVGGENSTGFSDSLTFVDRIGDYLEIANNSISINNSNNYSDLEAIILNNTYSISAIGEFCPAENKNNPSKYNGSKGANGLYQLPLGNLGAESNEWGTFLGMMPNGFIYNENDSTNYILYEFDSVMGNSNENNIIDITPNETLIPIPSDALYTNNTGSINLSDLNIWIEQNSNLSNGYGYTEVYFNIPTWDLPLSVVEINTDTNNYKTNYGSYGSLPIRLFFVTQLSKAITQDKVISSEDISSDYFNLLKKLEVEDNSLQFYSNYFDKQSTNGITQGNTYSTFSPGDENRYYSFQKPLILYTPNPNGNELAPNESGNPVLGSPITRADYSAPSSNSSLYMQIEYYSNKNNIPELTKLTVQRTFGDFINDTIYNLCWIDPSNESNYMDYDAEDTPSNYVLATLPGTIRVGDLNQSILEKTQNITSTANSYYLPTIEYGSNTRENNIVIQSWLGNNGIITTQTTDLPAENNLGNLIIKKTTIGNQTAVSTKFSFTLTLSDSSISGTYGDAFFNNGIANFTLGSGESFNVTNLPAGITYTLTENNTQGFSSTATNSAGTITANNTITANFINTSNEAVGQLTVSKTAPQATQSELFPVSVLLTQNGTPYNGNIAYTLTGNVTGVNNGYISVVNGQVSFNLSADSSITLTGIPLNTTYTVTEGQVTGYTPSYSPSNTGSITATSQRGTVNITNTKNNLGNLAISKTIAGESASTTDVFNFTITLGDTTINATYNGITFRNGIASITLRGGESITITGLPVGITYRVIEDNANQNGYESTSIGSSGTITASNTTTASFINTKNPEPEPGTGDLTVTKTVGGGAGDTSEEFPFIVTISSDSDINGVYGEMNFVNGQAEFTLKHNESITANNLPEGITYQVVEETANENGYVTTYTGDEGTIKDGQTSTAAFRNVKDEPSEEEPNLEINKYQSVNNGAQTQDYIQVQSQDIVTYYLVINNTSLVDAQDIFISDTIPEGLQINEASISDGGTYDSILNTVSWIISELKAQQSLTVSFEVIVPEGMVAETYFKNTASLVYNDEEKTSNEVVIGNTNSDTGSPGGGNNPGNDSNDTLSPGGNSNSTVTTTPSTSTTQTTTNKTSTTSTSPKTGLSEDFSLWFYIFISAIVLSLTLFLKRLVNYFSK